MKHFLKSILIPLPFLLLIGIIGCDEDISVLPNDETTDNQSIKKSQEYASVLSFDESSISKVDHIFSGVSYGELIKEHVRASIGFGKNAERKYQNSLSILREEPKIVESLFEIYQQLPAEFYLYRTMIVETLKQMKSDASLKYLYNIASLDIPRDTEPENPEIDTRLDEIIVRITATEGIGILAKNKNVAAEETLKKLTNHKDVSVRQMAVRAYLQSPFGNIERKIKELRDQLPKDEYWYITTKSTDIREVEHPEMPEKFDIKITDSKDAPKIY